MKNEQLIKKYFDVIRDKELSVTNKIKKLSYILNIGGNINDKERKSLKTGLMVALEQENKELVEWFLDNDCDVNAVDVEERTALFFVKDKDIAQRIVNKGADVNHNAYGGRTPLFANGGVDVARVLIDNGADIFWQTHYYRWNLSENSYTYIEGGISTLMSAVLCNDYDKAKLLIEGGVDVNKLNDNNENCLLYALVRTSNIDIELVKLLVDNGINLEEKDKNYNSIMHFVRRGDLADYLLKRGGNIYMENLQEQTPFMNVIEFGDVECVKVFVENSGDVNYMEKKSGETLLIGAIKHGRLDVIDYLIEKGADVNLEGKYGNRPIYSVVCSGSSVSKDILEKLIKNGVKINAKNCHGENAILMAVFEQAPLEVVDLLLKNGADYKVKNKSGVSAWDMLAMEAYKEGENPIADLVWIEEKRRKSTLIGKVQGVLGKIWGR